MQRPAITQLRTASMVAMPPEVAYATTPPQAPPPPSAPATIKACHSFDTHVDTDIVHGDMASVPLATGISIDDCCA